LRHFYGGARTRLFAVVIAAILVPATILLVVFIVLNATPVWWGSAPPHVISVVRRCLRAYRMSETIIDVILHLMDNVANTAHRSPQFSLRASDNVANAISNLV
jgi:hypothetical protein